MSLFGQDSLEFRPNEKGEAVERDLSIGTSLSIQSHSKSSLKGTFCLEPSPSTYPHIHTDQLLLVLQASPGSLPGFPPHFGWDGYIF